MGNNIFREKALADISSPEKLDNYIHVVGPGVWAVLLAVILLLAGFFTWTAIGSVNITDNYECTKKNSNEIELCINQDSASFLKVNSEVNINGSGYKVISISNDEEDNSLFKVRIDASGLNDGDYTVQINREVKPIKYLFN